VTAAARLAVGVLLGSPVRDAAGGIIDMTIAPTARGREPGSE
jgi:hypothetical protein